MHRPDGEPAPARRHPLRGPAAACLLVGVCLLVVYAFVSQPVQAGLFGVISFAAPVLVVIGAARNLDGGRRPWHLIAAALVVFAACDTAFNVQHLTHTAHTSLASAAYALGYPLLIAGMLLLVRAASGGWERYTLLEVGILTVALTLIQWVVAAGYGDSFRIGPTVSFAVVVTYALADGLLLASAEHIVVVTLKRAPASLALFLAVVALLVGDEAFALDPHTYALGAWPDIGWLLSYILFATAALAPSMREIPGPRPATLGMPVARLVSLGIALATLPALLILSAPLAIDSTMRGVLTAGGLLMVTLVLIRISDLVGSLVRTQSDELAERRRAEAARNQFAALIGNLQGGVLLEDPERRVVLVNEAFCRIFRLAESPDELVGTSTPHTSAVVAALVAEPGPFRRHVKRLTGRRRLRRGEAVDLMDGRSFLRDYIPVFREGTYLGSLWHYLEITDQKRIALELGQARDQALEATRLKSEFLAVMSHEIRTPMYGVIGAIDLLDETPLDAEQLELTNVLHDSAEALLGLLNDILDFSKIEAHKLTILDEELDLGSVVEGALDVFTVDAHRKGLWISSYVSPEIPAQLRGDASRLRQVLVNLLGNSVKFTPAGEVTVHAELTEADDERVTVRLRVTDTGIGIGSSAQQRLFQPFTQIDSSTTRTQPGTGLGLAICARIVELMGGTISCESTLGTGTAMTVEVALRRAARAEPADAPALPLEGRRAVLLTGRPLTLDAVASTLEGFGMTTLRARSVEEAGAALAGAHVVLCDAEQAVSLGASPPTIVLAAQRGAREGSGGAVAVLPVARNRLLALVCEVVESGLAGRPRRLRAVEPRDVTPRAAGATVLVVEDNDINRQLVVRQLARLGIPSRAVASGDEALMALDNGAYAAVLMDCRMPGMDGFATTKAIRGLEAGTASHVPIIAITADAQPQDRDRCLAAGMDDYLMKPLTVDALGACLARWLEPAGRPVHGRDLERLVDEVGESTVLELIQLWVGVLDERIETLQRSVEDDDAEAVYAAAHVLKSTSAVFGASKATRLAAELEARGRSGSVASATTLLADLSVELRLVGDELAAYSAAAGATPP